MDFGGTDRFQVVRQLGMGGMGVVYEAYDRERSERVAVKTLRDVAGAAILKLKNEFRALGGLHHPNLVQLGELFEVDGTWFFTMELVTGKDLMAWVRDDHDRLRDAIAQLVAGLGALHDAGRVHRDVKPSNVLVSDGRVVLLDFGLATRAAGEQLSWTDASLVGTPDYMAPEQAASQPVGPEADWYSVGVILYEALTGRPPIDGRPLEVLMNKQQQVPAPASSFAAVPPDLDALCAELLAIDPAKRPGRAEILRRLGGTRALAAAGTPPTQRQAFVGRSAELAQLRAALETGDQVSVLIEGESGMGKSALAQHFAEGLDRAEVVVLRGRCYERESVPYKAVDGVIDALSRWLGRQPDADAEAVLPLGVALLADVFPVLRGVKPIATARRRANIPDPHEQRRRVFGALRELLARLAERHRLVVLIDDLHWADQDSLALLDALLRPPEPPRLLLVGTAQPRGPDDPLARLALRRIVLGPLPPGETTQLVETLLTAARAPVGPTTVAGIVRESGGLPLFVAELVRHAALQGDAAPDLRLDEVLGARIGALETPERALLELTAIAGRPLALEVAGRALGLEPGALAPLVGYLQSANLLRATGRTRKDTVECFHDRIRKAVVAGIVDRPRTHRQLAVALEGSTVEDHPMVLATHWERAGDPPRAAAHYERAADRASAALAFDRAVRLYERSLTLQSESPHALRVKLADALGNVGRGRESADQYLAAAKTAATAADTLELERRAAAQLLRGGHIETGLAVLGRVLEAVGLALPNTPRRALASLLLRRAQVALRGTSFSPRDPSQITRTDLERIDTCWAATVGLSLTDYIRGASFQTQNLLLSLRAGEPFRAHRALTFEAGHHAAMGGRRNAARALQLIAKVEQGVDRADPYLHALVTGIRAFERYALGHWRDAFDLAEASDVELAERCTGVVWERDTMHTVSHWAQVYLGELRSLGEMLPERLRQAEIQGNVYAAGTLPSSVAIAHWLGRDDIDGAVGILDEIAARLPRTGFQVQHWNAMVARTMIELYRGDGAAAHAHIEETWRPLSSSLLMRVQIVRVEVAELRSRAALAAGALDLAEKMARRISREDLPWARALSQLRRGDVAAARGDTDGALRLLEEAVRGCDATETRLFGCGARWRLATLVGSDRADVLRREATEFLDSQGVVNAARMLALYAP